LLGALLGDHISLPGNELLCFDVNMFFFILTTTIVTSLIFGLAPAWQCIGNRARSTIRDNARTATFAKDHSRLRDTLVVTEIALALALMFCAGLMLRTINRPIRVIMRTAP
jgi:hypothetical protein